MAKNLSDHLSNEWHVAEKIATQTPAAIYDEVKADIMGNPKHVLYENVIGAGFGIGTAILTSRTPYLGAIAFGALALYKTEEVIRRGSVAAKAAWNADTDQQQQAVAAPQIKDLAGHFAYVTESLPGFIAAGWGTKFALNNSEKINSFANKFTQAVDYKIRGIMPEAFSWVGPGSASLGEDSLAADGSVNAVELAGSLGKSNPWKGIEVAQSVDVKSGKISRIIPGTSDEVTVGFPDQVGRIPFRTQNPEGMLKSLPSVETVNSTQQFGIVDSGESSSFYIGKGAQTDSPATMLKAVTLDTQEKNASLVNGLLDPKSGDWTNITKQPLNYDTAYGALSHIIPAKAWEVLSALPPKEAPPQSVPAFTSMFF